MRYSVRLRNSWTSRRRQLLALASASTLALAVMTLSSTPAGADATHSEQVGRYGVGTFTNYHNASGVGSRIEPYATVQVSCKVLDGTIVSSNPDGYWYRIASAPWNDQYFSPANTFYNGDPVAGPYTHNTDFSVPDCGVAPPSTPRVSLTQGPPAPFGYRYSMSLDGFAPSTGVSISCRDSVDTGGFYTFSLTTDASGHAATASYCYSADGPDHWVIAGGVESNHVTWNAPATGGGGGGTTGSGGGGTTGGPPIPVRNYVAMGDSYSSGEGNAPFDAGTATSANTCHRSSAAWPRRLGVPTSWHLACSGAVIQNFFSGQQAVAPDNEGQIVRLIKIDRSLRAVGQSVKAVTLTVGGNDLGFATIVRDCYYRNSCLNSFSRNEAVVQAMYPRLVKLYSLIRQAAPDAQVYVVDYPRLFPAQQSGNKTCGWLTPTERVRLNTLGTELNTAIRKAARAAGATAVDVEQALNGHELCTLNSWVFPVSPLKYGTDQRQAHPVGPGQNAYAAVVKAATGL